MAIKLVLFDIGGVLLDDIFPHLTQLISERYAISEQEFTAVRRKYWPAHLLGKTDIREFFINIFRDLKLPQKDVPDIIKKSYSFLLLKKDSLEIAKQLKVKNGGDIKGIKLGILSNNTKEWAAYSLETYGLSEHFDPHLTFFSCDMHLAKPFPEIYAQVLSKTRLKPEEILFIDNNAHNVASANRLGIKAVLFTGAEQLKKDLVAMRLL